MAVAETDLEGVKLRDVEKVGLREVNVGAEMDLEKERVCEAVPVGEGEQVGVWEEEGGEIETLCVEVELSEYVRERDPVAEWVRVRVHEAEGERDTDTVGERSDAVGVTRGVAEGERLWVSVGVRDVWV